MRTSRFRFQTMVTSTLLHSPCPSTYDGSHPKRGLPGAISKRSRSPENVNVSCLVAASAQIFFFPGDLEWHSPFGGGGWFLRRLAGQLPVLRFRSIMAVRADSESVACGRNDQAILHPSSGNPAILLLRHPPSFFRPFTTLSWSGSRTPCRSRTRPRQGRAIVFVLDVLISCVVIKLHKFIKLVDPPSIETSQLLPIKTSRSRPLSPSSFYSFYAHFRCAVSSLSRTFTTLGKSHPTHPLSRPSAPQVFLRPWLHIYAACLATTSPPPPCTEKPSPAVAPHQPQLLLPFTCRRHRQGQCHRRQARERHKVRFIVRGRIATILLLWCHHLSVIRPMILVFPTKIAARSIGLRAISHILIRKVRATSRTLDPYQFIRSSSMFRGTQGVSLNFRRADT